MACRSIMRADKRAARAALPHDRPRRDCLGREGSVGGDGANEKRELERFFALNRRAEGRACDVKRSAERRRSAPQAAGVREAVEGRAVFVAAWVAELARSPLSGLPTGVAGLFPSSPSVRPLHFGNSACLGRQARLLARRAADRTNGALVRISVFSWLHTRGACRGAGRNAARSRIVARIRSR